MTLSELTRRFSKNISTVFFAIDRNNERERHKQRAAAAYARLKATRGRPPKYSPHTIAEIVGAKKKWTARETGEKFGISRNAVIGLWHRHGASAGATPC